MESYRLNKSLEKDAKSDVLHEFNLAMYILWGVGLLFLTAQISIPLEPVPITLQTVGVMLVGLLFKRKQAIHAVITYLGLGAIGFPVFASYHGGYQYLYGSTGGYLWGFLAAVLVMTSLKPYLNYQNFFHLALNCFLGTLVIFSLGIGWLAHLIGFKQALLAGFYPFIVPGAIKILVLTGVIRYLNLK